MYNPIELSKKVEKIVLKNNRKKYYRFRPAKFYGGISTADAVGCNLRCKFCWSSSSVWNAKNTGDFYSSEEVADKLNEIAIGNRFSQLRISGGEPTIGRKHLIKVLANINSRFIFILETNGILLGADKTYVEELSQFKNLHVRVCFKGCSPDEFSWFTGANEGFEYQWKSLEYLKDEKVNFNIALVSIKRDRQEFFNRLTEMGLENIMFEDEEITLYPQVKQRLEKEGILHFFE